MILYKGNLVPVYPLLISGKQGSGKTTTAKLVSDLLEDTGFGVVNAKFADTLYKMHDACLRILKARGITVPEKSGTLLQLLGTEYGRKVHGEDVWVNCALGAYEELVADAPKDGSFYNDIVYVIDDARFKNELAAFNFGFAARLECAKDVRKARCPAWRDNDTHQSETDLDDSLDKFDVVINTALVRPEDAAEAIVADMRAKFKI